MARALECQRMNVTVLLSCFYLLMKASLVESINPSTVEKRAPVLSPAYAPAYQYDTSIARYICVRVSATRTAEHVVRE